MRHVQHKDNLVVQCDQVSHNWQCTTNIALHYANGEVRYDRDEYRCEPI